MMALVLPQWHLLVPGLKAHLSLTGPFIIYGNTKCKKLIGPSVARF